MYQAGDKVVYGMHGVCVVADLEQRVVDHKEVTYLVLEPIGQPGARFLVPSHNPAAMSKVKAMLTREELEQLLSSDAIHQDAWIKDESRRKQVYRELIGSGSREKLLQMVCSLYRCRNALRSAGKKFHMCDENFLRDAEKLLASELSVTLELSTQEAIQYLRKALKEDAQGAAQ